MRIICLPIFQDNYIWMLVSEDNKVVAVDPGDAEALEIFLKQQKLELRDIFITHHHNDHIGGVIDLAKRYQVTVYGPDENINGVTHILHDNQEIYIEMINCSFNILGTPGHTLGHIAYYNVTNGLLFCGDTLFSAGCGRIFEGTPAQMYSSLQKINELPDDTLIYCTHEYTLRNLKFAKYLEPNNIYIQEKINAVTAQLKQGMPSLPTKLADERRINPFLRCNTPSIVERLQNIMQVKFDYPLQVFTNMRMLKDNF